MKKVDKDISCVAVFRLDHGKIGKSGDYELTLPQFEEYCNTHIFHKQKFKGGTLIITYPTLFYASGPVQRKQRIVKFRYWNEIAEQFAKGINKVNTFVKFKGYKGPDQFMLCHEGDVHIICDIASRSR
jgi:hypothetical protein